MYPEIRPFATEHLKVDELHSLYLEQSGNPKGIPVLFIHGGPGSSCSPAHRRFFDPEKYWIVLFDQRGAGKSRPHASLESNTTQHLIEDIESIRRHLGVSKWLLFGGSWGATLSLAYAQAHPESVLGMVLRGIFLCRPRDIDWLYQEGASRLFPDYWDDFISPVDSAKRSEMVPAYYELLTGENEIARMRAAEAWSLWEGRVSTLAPNESLANAYTEPFAALAMARIECHYFMQNGFLEPDQLLNEASKLSGIPTKIIHGRYDCVCPIDQAWALYEALDQAEIQIISDAGHSAFEPGIRKALVAATDEFAEVLV